MRTDRLGLRAATILFVLAACSLRPYTFADSATDTTGTTTSTTAEVTTTANITAGITTTSSSSSGTASGSSDGSATTAAPPPDLGVGEHCSVWYEDCPEGQKCMAYSGDGDLSWESSRCVDIVPDPDGLGEPCMVFGSSVSGEDTCDRHMLCWHPDEDTGIGTCIGMCIGTPDVPDCVDPNAFCALSGGGGVLIACLPMCDPLASECGPNEVCVPVMTNFSCSPDAGGDPGQVFDPCDYINACAPGLGCFDTAVAVECDPMAVGCCSPFCDINEPNTCPGEGQVCVAWYEPGMAPPKLAHLGICMVPDP